MKDNLFEQLDFGAFQEYIDNDDITDISYTNNGQLWVRSLTQGSLRVENGNINNSVVEKLAFQCSNVMGVSFNNACPFLDAESPELRMNFVHDSIATNGIALVIRKTPAKIRLKEDTLLDEDYVTKDIHDFLIKCVHGHCNIIVCGETGSGKTEFVKYLASHTVESEKLITIEDTLELHLDKIYPHRDIVAMKTNNIASYSDVLVTCMRQNPKWILLSEVRSAEAVSAVRNSISSGHNILSTIHSDKANAIPHRMYSLMETDLDVDQFLNTIYRYVQLGVHIKAYYSPKYKKFHREIDEITEFYIDEDNQPVYNIIYQKTMSGKIVKKNPSQHLLDYLAAQNIDIGDTTFDNSESGGLSLEDVVGEKSEEEVLKEQKEKEESRKQTEKESTNSEELQPEAIVDPSVEQQEKIEVLTDTTTSSDIPSTSSSISTTQQVPIITPAAPVTSTSSSAPISPVEKTTTSVTTPTAPTPTPVPTSGNPVVPATQVVPASPVPTVAPTTVTTPSVISSPTAVTPVSTTTTTTPEVSTNAQATANSGIPIVNFGTNTPDSLNGNQS